MPPPGPEKKNLVPVAIVSNAPESTLLPYASQIIQSVYLPPFTLPLSLVLSVVIDRELVVDLSNYCIRILK